MSCSSELFKCCPRSFKLLISLEHKWQSKVRDSRRWSNNCLDLVLPTLRWIDLLDKLLTKFEDCFLQLYFHHLLFYVSWIFLKSKFWLQRSTWRISGKSRSSCFIEVILEGMFVNPWDTIYLRWKTERTDNPGWWRFVTSSRTPMSFTIERRNGLNSSSESLGTLLMILVWWQSWIPWNCSKHLDILWTDFLTPDRLLGTWFSFEK